MISTCTAIKIKSSVFCYKALQSLISFSVFNFGCMYNMARLLTNLNILRHQVVLLGDFLWKLNLFHAMQKISVLILSRLGYFLTLCPLGNFSGFFVVC